MSYHGLRHELVARTLPAPVTGNAERLREARRAAIQRVATDRPSGRDLGACRAASARASGARTDRGGASATEKSMLRLQRQCGNRAVGSALARKHEDSVAPLGRTPASQGACPACAQTEKEHDAAASSGARAVEHSVSEPTIQRRMGDGHDLSSPRFAGDPVLEACFDNERVLSVGSSGPSVRTLQQALIDAGFPLPKFGVDGQFGSETRNAVVSFQQTSGLNPDGIVGPLTMGALDARFSGPSPTPTPPTPVPPVPTPPTPTPPVPTPPVPTPPVPTPPVPIPPVPTPPGPTPPVPTPPAPVPETIVSETVATSPGVRTRKTIGVGEEVNLTHAPGSAAWATTDGKLSSNSGIKVLFTAPDTAKTVTVTAGTATLAFDVIAPSSVAMDREPGTGVKHTHDRPDSGIQTRVFLGPDTVNFSKARYRELDVNATASVPGPYSCFASNTGHCGAGGGGNPCPDKALSTTVVSGMGTQSVLGDCAYSGFCSAQTAPFAPGSISFSIPYEYRVGTGAFHFIVNVPQLHTLAADASTLASSKAGANGSTTVAAGSVTIVQCP